ncbi:MAG TPA: MutS family DNA mismatch repair protein [Ignavibacteria bacterium]|nr:MutS family DNA mismatch repair protein [Ignavibacteria bacterium]
MNSYESRLNHLLNLSAKINERIDYLLLKSNKYSFRRLWIFLAGLILTIILLNFNSAAGLIAAVISLIIFAVTVHFHNRLLQSVRKFSFFKKLQDENIARMKVDWSGIPENINIILPEESSTFKDLDLTGSKSLHRLLDTSVSMEGSGKLAKHISQFSPDVKLINRNQKIVKELSVKKRFRDKLILKARLISLKPLSGSDILKWIKKTEHTTVPDFLIPVSFIFIFTFITLFILYSLGITGNIWFAVFLMYLIFYGKYQKQVSSVFEESALLSDQVRKFSVLIQMIEKYKFDDNGKTSEFLEIFKAENEGASDELKKLERLIAFVRLRENPVYRLIFNLLLPYDFILCKKLLTLISDIEHKLPLWLEKFYELECLISLANFTYLNPDYCFPDFETGNENTFEIKNCGHPLLVRNKKICNDFAFENSGIILITGSNMSGKSTFLKTIGINHCLANAGAPVNADLFRSSVYNLFTCIKVNDSVSDGISYFYAEVKRLKELIDDLNNSKGRKIFFLIDEIFKGTNNKERLTGSREFIKFLSGQKCAGFISTHDLELVNLSQENFNVTNFHFREEIINNEMIFDYKIHPGPCPTTNALKIMKIAGLPV